MEGAMKKEGPRKHDKHERAEARKFHDVSYANWRIDREADEQERRFARRFHGRVMSETGRD